MQTDAHVTSAARTTDPKRGYRYRPSRPHLTLNMTAGVIAALMLLPTAYLILRAFGVGIGHAVEMLAQPRTLQVIANSAVLALLVTGLSLLLALPLAWLTVRTDLPGRRAWSILSVLPLVYPSYVGGYAFVATMGPRGIVQDFLEPLGIERLPSVYGLPGATWVLTIFTYPYLLLPVRAALLNTDPALEEAARNLGYGAWQTFRHVTLPALRPSIAAGSLLVALYVLSDFGAVSILRFNSFTRAIYVQYVSSFDRSLAAVLSLVLVVMTILLLFAAQRFQGQQRLYRAGVGTARTLHPVPLGRWRVPALLFCAGVVTASLIMPTAVVTYWLMRGVQAGESLLPVWAAAGNSVQAAVLAGAVAVVLALPVAYLAVRFPSRYSLLVSQAVYLGYGLPGIVIALSLVFFGANYAPIVYQTLAMLIFGYTVRFLPQAMGNVRTGLMQISPRLEEAGRSLGVGRRTMLRRITLPLLRPSIWTGAALVFMSTLKELPITLLLGPTGFTTLATQIWAAADEAFFARAAAPSLLLLAVSAVGVGIILRQEERGR
ncbi:MAG: iron ABC transporter permease [Caldilineaceae bacterium]|nr:iron ABC transporter permease [Caldilineaceae bacterium]